MEQPYTSAQVELMLYQAGRTLLALRVSGCWPGGYRSSMPEMLREAIAGYGYVRADYKVAAPLPRQVSAMDLALSWLTLLPGETEADITLRRLVCARLLVSPRSDRPIYSWRRLGILAGCSENTAKTRWLDAVGRITVAVNRAAAAAGGVSGHRRNRVAWRRRPCRVRVTRDPAEPV